MIPLMRPLVFAMLLYLGMMSGRAASTTTAPAPVTDPTIVSAHYHQVVLRPEFQATEDTDLNAHLKEVLSHYFLRIGEKFGEFKYASEMSQFASMLLTLFALLAVVGLVYVSFRVFRRRRDLEELTQTSTTGKKMFRPPEFYEGEIQDAIQARDWHTAWLATWRQFLSRLEKQQLVEPDRTRTNREYLEQLRTRTLPAPALALLSGMIDAYDRYIYGHQSIGEPDWNLFHQHVNEVVLLLHLEDSSTSSFSKQGKS